jgi:PWI domain
MAGNFFRGTTVDQDGRWGKSDEKLIAKMQKAGKFAAILDTKIDIKKVNIDIISKWVSEKTIEVLGFEDEIVINLVINMLQSENLHGKKMQLDVTGFLEKGAGAFVEELWNLLVDAQSQPNGIPEAFIRKKKEEILRRQRAILMVTNAALQQNGSTGEPQESDTKPGRWGPHQSAPLSADDIRHLTATSDGRKTVDDSSRNSDLDPNGEGDKSRAFASVEATGSKDHRGDDDQSRSDRRTDERSSRGDRRRDRSRSHDRSDRNDRDLDHRDHGRHRSSRDSGRHRDSHRSRDRDRDRDRDRNRDRDRDMDRDRDRDRDRERHSHRDRSRDRSRNRSRDRSRERHRSRKDDRSDSRRDKSDKDRISDSKKNHKRDRSKEREEKEGRVDKEGKEDKEEKAEKGEKEDNEVNVGREENEEA